MSIDTYHYQGSDYCGGCGIEIRNRFLNEGQEDTQDSDLLPQGPNQDLFSDHPEHCVSCGTFLSNDLTADGWSNLHESVIEAIGNRDVPERVRLWVAYYQVELFNLIDHADPKEESTEPEEEEYDEQLRQD